MLTHERDDLYVHMENVLYVRQNQGDPCKSKKNPIVTSITIEVSPTRSMSEHYCSKQTKTQAIPIRT